ncbi:MAG: ribosomal protein S18-alanine N-acetyltransferase [Reyranella sp.]|uniref:ribosomal protein S18-alanine N-acetyltransferase n=1 Tax=Reyranella sp. TaxID=1929291 RepID=UPI001ACAD558|nr:ribosomal protein S18-alanine N-acetyltransferase [Reyranella sp.]MBN9090103.1 ribosomal protein S18-alanine N-acetyltransferase [Reyranella sp.]
MNGRFMVRPIGALDLDRAARLHRSAFAALGERPWTRQDMAELLASSTAGGFFLLVDGEDAGIALWRTTVDEAELLTIAVDAAHRRRGVARALLDAVIERVREHGARVLFLEVGVDNPPALSLYAQAGFTEVGRRLGYYQRHRGVADALILRLLLNDGG